MTVHPIFFQDCQVCGRPMRIRVEWLGRRIRCGHCHATVQTVDYSSYENKQTEKAGQLNRPTIEGTGVSAVDSENTSVNRDTLETDLADHAILLVEDDRKRLDAMSRYLTDKRHCVTPVHHPRMALEAISIQPHRIAVVKLRLPEFDGVRLAKMLHRYVSNLHVIFLLEANDIDDFYTDAFACLKQPFSFERLEETVQQAIKSTTQEIASQTDNQGDFHLSIATDCNDRNSF